MFSSVLLCSAINLNNYCYSEAALSFKMKLSLLFAGIVLYYVAVSSGFIAYDCAHKRTNFTALSIWAVGECPDIPDQVSTQTKQIQLLQINEHSLIHVYQCKAAMIRTIYHCGSFSHSSLVSRAITQYVEDISRTACIGMHVTKTWNLYGSIVDRLRLNSTQTYHKIVAGDNDFKGSCTGGSYTAEGVVYKDVVVELSITLTLYDYETTVKKDEGLVSLRGGYTCPYNKDGCMDSEGGNTYWEYTQHNDCLKDQYNVLYSGEAVETTATSNGQVQKMYSVKTGDIIFSLMASHPVPLCYLKGLSTEHPSLFIYVADGGDKPFTRTIKSAKNMDMFTYVNSKFVHVERHLRSSIESLYKDVVRHRCDLERTVLETRLGMASSNPIEFAYLVMGGPGYTALQMGEVVYIIQCQPVEVQLRETPSCYQEIPITYLNKSTFVTPRSRLIQQYGTQVDCNSLMYPTFYLNEDWYKVHSGPHLVKAPGALNPKVRDTWKYTDPGSLIQAGLYTKEALDKLRHEVMFPSERSAITNILTRITTQTGTIPQGVSIHGLLDDETMEHLAQSLTSRMWGWFSWLGNVVSGLLGFWICGKFIKFAIDTAVHAYSLREVFGCSWYMCGMFWDACTWFLLRNKPTKPKADEDDPCAITMKECGKYDEHIVLAEPYHMPSAPKDQVCYPKLPNA